MKKIIAAAVAASMVVPCFSVSAAVRQVSMSELVREAIDEIFRREKEKQQKNEAE